MKYVTLDEQDLVDLDRSIPKKFEKPGNFSLRDTLIHGTRDSLQIYSSKVNPVAIG